MTHDYLRNDTSGTFAAHLFRADEIDAAGGAAGSQAERPVTSICSRTTSYGPFRAVDAEAADDGLPDHDGGLCEVCRERLAEATEAADGDADEDGESAEDGDEQGGDGGAD